MTTHKKVSVTRRRSGAWKENKFRDFVTDFISLDTHGDSYYHIPDNAVGYIRFGNTYDYPMGSDANRGAWLNIKELMELSNAIDAAIEDWYKGKNR